MKPLYCRDHVDAHGGHGAEDIREVTNCVRAHVQWISEDNARDKYKRSDGVVVQACLHNSEKVTSIMIPFFKPIDP